ncbi:MAG: hypothetical protein ABIH66_06685 [bacterium]
MDNSKGNSTPPGSACRRQLWRRVHRPEEYLRDIAKETAKQWGVPFPLFAPFIPPMRRMLKSWEPAAVETTEYSESGDGSRTLRTVFDITNYSNRRVYALVGALQRFFTRKSSEKVRRAGFEWDILGGVLTDYARRAGLRRDTAVKLLDFRLENSDYLTLTTWYNDRVEIANLKTGRVEELELPPGEIAKVVDWSVRFQRSLCGGKTRALAPGCPEWREYLNILGDYEKATGKQG